MGAFGKARAAHRALAQLLVFVGMGGNAGHAVSERFTPGT
jgi:hypothetical protein